MCLIASVPCERVNHALPHLPQQWLKTAAAAAAAEDASVESIRRIRILRIVFGNDECQDKVSPSAVAPFWQNVRKSVLCKCRCCYCCCKHSPRPLEMHRTTQKQSVRECSAVDNVHSSILSASKLHGANEIIIVSLSHSGRVPRQSGPSCCGGQMLGWSDFVSLSASFECAHSKRGRRSE